MKPIIKIAKAELKQLFFSPIAWLIIVIFAFQTGLVFNGIYTGMMRRQLIGWKLWSVTASTFGGIQGTFTIVQQYIFLYIPLLTMGIMSREFSSGSIKLLYSSPLKSRQIIFGKYLALVAYAFVLMLVLAVYGIYAVFTIKAVDIPLILTGLLGLFLLTCAYAAIGLFMSSLTSYTVVSAMGTLGIFAVLNYVKSVGQDVEFVRDITYWLAISGRSDNFIAGLITSEDLLYFLIVIALFIGFSVVKLQSGRQKKAWYITFGMYAGIFAGAMMLGYFSAKPKLMTFYDSTRTKTNTLTKSSQEVLSHLNDGLTITTYSNMLDENYWIAMPDQYKYDVDRFRQYIRFKPGIKLKYEFYYEKNGNKQLDKQYPTLNSDQLMDTLVKLNDYKFPIYPYSKYKPEADLSSERFRFVRSMKRENGKQTYLRVYDDMMRLPTETEITAAIKRLVIDKLPTVGFLTGHGERSSNAEEDRGYNMFAQEITFRHALINQGFDFENVTLDKEIPAHIRVLLIAEPKRALSADEMKMLQQYIDRGGNMIIAGEPGRQDVMNPIVENIGVKFMPGMLVKPSKKFQSDLLLLTPTKQSEKIAFHFKSIREIEQLLPMKTAVGLEYATNKGFDVVPLFTSDSSGSWNELETKNFIDDTVLLNTRAGEVEMPYTTAIAMSRKVNGTEQKIIVVGDADYLSNGELMMSRKDISPANFNFISGSFFWLTNNELPIDMRRPHMPDNALKMSKTAWTVSGFMLKWLFPIALMCCGTIIWLRRKSR
ncbi:ABC transporter permease subunit [Pseudoflavitalea sp. G-6-1-2]|uniref:Gldg family protein n=1 Tax=Pseudoflavitalea sp. G-6-1-2 TaxID=2728841 RepID=UPI00146BDF9E|nr:Gldg family protein [Pseudoflavitalea sp. G-6-1-2]NML22280.1 ABC transporter permease subunit [Pseudoflavitalea sp. G-6-1-2]